MLHDLLADLAAEQQTLDEVVVGLDASALDAPTPAVGWTVRDQVSHLAFSEELAGLAATDDAGFQARLAQLFADLTLAETEPRARAHGLDAPALVAWWRDARAGTIRGLERRTDGDRVPWVMGPMSAVSFATARLMETWAHGQDIVDAIGATRPPTDRLRHIAHLGVATRGFAYQINGLELPAAPVRVELVAPDGGTWAWGPEDATDSVRGTAEDFCLLVTQRRHLTDTGLVALGTDAAQWLSIAQAFAGPPGEGRAPLGAA